MILEEGTNVGSQGVAVLVMLSHLLGNQVSTMLVTSGYWLVEQIGGDRQVDLGGLDIDVSHEGRKPRQPLLNIDTFPVPA